MRTTTMPGAAAGRGEAVDAILAELGQALGSLRCASSQRLLRLGLSMTHFHVLTLLRHHDAMPMGRLAEVLDASMSSATGIIDRMEERGLVERVRVQDDRRIVLVQPTAAGRALVDEAELVKSDLLGAVIARLSPEQLERLNRTVADLRGAVEAELATHPDLYQALAHGHHHGHGPTREPSTTPAPA